MIATQFSTSGLVAAPVSTKVSRASVKVNAIFKKQAAPAKSKVR